MDTSEVNVKNWKTLITPPKLDINISEFILIKKLNKNEIKIIIATRTNNNLPKEILIRY